jgi:hypothetical protein
LGVTRNGGYFEYKPMFVDKMPIPTPTQEERENIEIIVDKILSFKDKNKDISHLDVELNNYIYNLYQLTAIESDYINAL